MELAVLGGSLWLAKQFLPKPQQKIMVSAEEEFYDKQPSPPEEFLYKELRRGGVIFPSWYDSAGRIPWDPQRPPYTLYPANSVTGDHMKDVTERIYGHYQNARWHERMDFEEQTSNDHEYFITKRGQPLPTSFTRELHNPSDPNMTTDMINWSWLPPNPQDMDFVRAGELAKKIPRDPSLFTPESNFMAIPGLTWRYQGRGGI